MRPARNQWPETQASRNVLIAAQMLREVLGGTTYASFRVTTMDIKSRLRELAALTREISRERVPLPSIDPCLSELTDAFSRDQVANEIIGHEIELFNENWSVAKRSEKNLALLQRFVIFAHRKLGDNYKRALEGAILLASQKDRANQEASRLITAYCSTLINDGYSREYILQEVERRFFSHDIRKVERRTLQRFFSAFSGKIRRFSVTIPVSSNLGSYLSKLQIPSMQVKQFSDLDNQTGASLATDRRHHSSHQYFVLYAKAPDPFSALRLASEVLSSIVAMTYLGRRGIDLEWHRHAYVKAARAAAGELIANDQIVFQQQTKTLTRRVINELKTYTEQILKEFTPESTDRLLSAINISALSRSSPRPENQLITLWSAIEVLLSDPPRGVPRVVHYVDMLTPCICIKYVRRYIMAVLDELRVHYPKHMRDFFRRKEFDSSVDQYTNFTLLMYRAELKGLHEEFCAPLARNPLALYHLWKLEKIFGNRGALLKALEGHEERVRWQLFRIYRTRNNIVHSGDIPTFLTPLVRNVFEYFQSAMSPILIRAAAIDRRSSIDQIVAEIGFDYGIMKGELSGGDREAGFGEDDLAKFHR